MVNMIVGYDIERLIYLFVCLVIYFFIYNFSILRFKNMYVLIII